MRPDRFFLVRHGQSESNVNKDVCDKIPNHRVPLTDLGALQSASTGEQLRILTRNAPTQFYVSPFLRTKQSFAEISKSFDKKNVSVEYEPLIREREYGLKLNVKSRELIYQDINFHGEFYYRFHHGESPADVYTRVEQFLGKMFRHFDKINNHRNVVLVTHGVFIRTFMMRWFHWDEEQFENMIYPKNGQIYQFDRKGLTNKFVLDTEIAFSGESASEPLEIQT
jgi:broad specificity phosphatase PhoE